MPPPFSAVFPESDTFPASVSDPASSTCGAAQSRLVPAPGISACPSSNWSPPRVYPPVPPPIGPRP
eukprot:538882-Pyramimonas_sp.AAC.2